MADNTVKTFINISNSKRQRTEDFEQTRISQLNISSERRCIQLFDERLTEVEINPHTGIDDGLDSPQFNDETLTMLPMSTYDQYTSLLILESKAWMLCDTVFGVVSDFELTKTEEVKLTKTFLVVNTDSELCLRCCDHKCIHYQAFEQCSINDHLNLCQPNYVKSYSIFNLSPSIIFLIDNIDLHCFNKKEMKWFCSTCLGKCSRSAILKSYLPDYEFNEPTSEQKEILYPVISSLPIPVSFDDNMISVYEEQQLCKDLNLPLELFPEKELCDNEYNFHKEGAKLERKGIIVYTSKAVIELAEHKVYGSVCDGTCKCKGSFDGNSNLLLNVNNKYFIHYDLLYEYSEFMTLSINTLHGYLRAKNSLLKRLGRKKVYFYHIVKHGWNAYLRMVNVNYKSNFTCPICKDSPEVIVLDGVTLGTLKHVPIVSHLFDEEQHFNLIPITVRLFIYDSATRKMLKDYCMVGLAQSIFIEMLNSITSKVFIDYIMYSSIEINGWRKVHEDFPGVSVVIDLLSYPSPLCGIFQCSLLTKKEREDLVVISKGGYLSTSQLQQIFLKLNSLKQLFSSLPARTREDGLITPHHLVSPLLTLILTKIDSLFKQPTRQLIEFRAAYDDYFMYFPTFSTNYKIPIYESEKASSTYMKCTKIYPKHNRFSPGMLVMACKHKVCYGFEILRERESTIVVYNMLISIFKKLPKIIIYDNACNLHTTCIMRDPALFRDTAFLVDRFHFLNHKCSKSYSMRSIQTDDVRLINSQVCEQIFSVLRRISTQISYMRLENVFYNTRYFLAILNEQILLNINK